MDDLIEAAEDKYGHKNTKIPSAQVKDKFTTLVNADVGTSHAAPLKTPSNISNVRLSKTPCVKKEEETEGDNPALENADVEVSLVTEISKEEQIKVHLEKWIYPEWQKHVEKRRAEGVWSQSPGLERFESGEFCSTSISRTCINDKQVTFLHGCCTRLLRPWVH